METTEHRVQVKSCPNCYHQNQVSCPPGIDYRAQYGGRTKALFGYLNIQQLLPLKRLTEMIHDLTGHFVSQGVIVHANESQVQNVGVNSTFGKDQVRQ